MGAVVGLRELKKQMTRDAIATAALNLTRERGVSNITVEEIAREALVSVRTVSNYFSSKEDAVLAAGTMGVMEILEQFTADPSDDPPLATLCRIVRDHARENAEHLSHTAEMVELEELNPTLKPVRAARQAEFEELLRQRVAARTGSDAQADLYPALVAAAATSAITTALHLWARAELPPERLPDVLQEAFDIAAAGYPHPGK